MIFFSYRINILIFQYRPALHVPLSPIVVYELIISILIHCMQYLKEIGQPFIESRNTSLDSPLEMCSKFVLAYQCWLALTAISSSLYVLCVRSSKYQLAIGHFLTKIGYFRRYVKVFGPFSDYLITPNPQNYIKWSSTFVNGQTLVEVFGHLSMYCSFLILNSVCTHPRFVFELVCLAATIYI